MAQKKTTGKKITGKKTASKKGRVASKRGRVGRYRLDKGGQLIGPNGRRVALEAGDIPIVVNGGSLSIVSVGDLDDDDHPGQKTQQLRSSDTTKHVTSIQLVGFTLNGATSNTFVPSNTTTFRCNIIIHYS